MAKEDKYKAMFEDAQKCFGKLYDSNESECTKKCVDADECEKWNKGKVERKSTEESEDKSTSKKEPEKSKGKAETAKSTKKPAGKKEPEKSKGTESKSDAKKPAAKKSEGKDANGFKVGSKASMMHDMLLEGKHTKEAMLKILDKKYPGANNKTTLSVFINDLQKPVGTYSGSRGTAIVTNEKTGVLSVKK